MTEAIKTKLKQTKPFASDEETAFLAIQLAAEELKTGFNELFKTRDLTSVQYNVLRILRGAGKVGISCREISDRMITRDPDITRMLDRLESRGLIKRERRADDRRVILTFITSEGLELLRGLDRRVGRLHKEQLGHLSRSELKTVAKILSRIGAGR